MASIQVSEQETTSPHKLAICSPHSKEALTPSTEAESPYSAATPELEAEACPDSAAAPELETEAETVPSVAEAPSPEAESPDSAATQELEAEPSWEFEAETEPLAAEAVSAETPTEEELVWMQYLPKLSSEEPMAPPSWIAGALAVETMFAEDDLAAMRDFPKVSQPPWLFHTVSSKVPPPSDSWLQRSPKYDPVTKMKAYSALLAQEGDEDESDEEFNQMRQAAFSKLEEKCATAATHLVAQEVAKAKWRSLLSSTCANTHELLVDIETIASI